MKKHLSLTDEFVMSRIHHIRNQKVMLDKDLAELYGVTPRRLREQVNRNKERFPLSFMFRLTKKELGKMVSQNATPSKQKFGGSLPYVFTEHGTLMIANVLKSKRAIDVSVRLIEIFVRIRKEIVQTNEILLKLELLERKASKSSEDIDTIFSLFRQLLKQSMEPRKRVGFRRHDEED